MNLCLILSSYFQKYESSRPYFQEKLIRYCLRKVLTLAIFGFSYSGNAFLDQQGIAYKTSWDLWSGQVALAGIAVVFLGLTYVQLRRIKKFK